MSKIGIKSSFYVHALTAKLRLFARNPAHLGFYLRHYSQLIASPAPDIDIVSYPKSGRTWLEQLLLEAALARHGLLAPPPKTVLELRKRVPRFPLINFTHAGSSWESRVLTGRELLAYGTRDARAQKLVYLHRDPRDVLVSAYFHAKFRTGLTGLAKSELIDSPILGIDKIVNFMNLWHAFVMADPDRAISISYEDLHRDPAGTMRRIESFLLLGLGDDHIERAVEACRFERMQGKERSGDYDTPWLTPVDAARPESFKVRSGKVGEHRSFFTPEEIKQLDRRIRHGLQFDYTLPEETAEPSTAQMRASAAAANL